MTDYAISIVWNLDAEDAPEEVGEAATAVSNGCLVTTYHVTAEVALRAYDVAMSRGLHDLSKAGAPAVPIGFAVEPASPTPHFLLGAIGR